MDNELVHRFFMVFDEWRGKITAGLLAKVAEDYYRPRLAQAFNEGANAAHGLDVYKEVVNPYEQPETGNLHITMPDEKMQVAGEKYMADLNVSGLSEQSRMIARMWASNGFSKGYVAGRNAVEAITIWDPPDKDPRGT